MGFFCKSSSSTAPVFGFSSTAEQVTEGIDASDRTAIVTGASGGIGIETARVLALRGAQVVLAVRNVAAGEKTKESILKETSNSARLHVLELDLSSIQSVRNFCRNFLALNLPLNILVNNAGIMACPFALSVDGIESQFATNHVGHFLLTNLLLDKMKSTAKETGIQGRIVNVSSMGHKLFTYPGGIRFHTLNDESTYSRERAYGQSKLANILHAKELARRFEEEGVNLVANALHPGIIKTNLTRNSTSFRLIETIVVPFAGKSIPQAFRVVSCCCIPPSMAGIGPVSQDWEPVVIRKRAPNAAASRDEKAVNAARRSGGPIETIKKYNAGSNKASSSTPGLNTKKLDDETEVLAHERVSADLKKSIMQGRLDKKLTQAQLAQQINEKPQIIQEYESGKAIPNQQIITKLERVLGVKLRGKK